MSEIIKLSVCMLAYNHENYIKEAIEGVLSQKCDFNIELIIGEDCSIDNTKSICLEYKKKYPHLINLISSEYNVGMIDNFVRVVNAAKGEYLAFCEGDDYWTDLYKIQKQVDFLENNSAFGMCYSNVLVYNQEKGLFEDRSLVEKEIEGYEQLILGNYIPTLSVCCRKKLVDKFLQKYSDYYYAWPLIDYPLWLYISCYSKIYFLPDIVGVYRVLRESASHSVSEHKLFDFAKKTVDIVLVMDGSLQSQGCLKEKSKYKYLFFKQYYSWFIGLGNMKYTKNALSCFLTEQQYFSLFLSLLLLPFWKCKKLPFIISNLKSLLRIY